MVDRHRVLTGVAQEGGQPGKVVEISVQIAEHKVVPHHPRGAAGPPGRCATDGKIAVVLAAVSPMALKMGVMVLVGMFAGLGVWKRRSVSVPAAVGLYLGVVGWMVVGWW